jgi:thioredoxin reductase
VTWDCVIVGAGPAGLNAALVLGRARRRVVVLDDAQPRNYATHEMHGVLGHDGLDSAELRARGRAELAADVWGISAHTCPYCDGFEHRDERLAVLASGARGEHLALLLRQWSDDVVLLSNGSHGLAADQRARVDALAIPIVETPVAALEGDDQGRLRRVRLDDGETLDRDALFFYVGWQLRNDLARRLGCGLRDDGSIAVDSEQATTVDRVYAAGNCAEPRALVPTAAGAGVTAAVSINVRLTFEDADRAVAGAAAPAGKIR